MHLDYVHEPVPPLRAVLTEPVVLSVTNYFWLAFIDVALLALQPLFYATPIHLGGLGMSPATIGLCLGIFGLLDGVAQGLVFPQVIRRVGLKKLFVTALFCFTPLFALFPIINHLARKWGLSPAVWALVVFQLMINCVTEMAFGRWLSLKCQRYSHCPCRVNPGCSFIYVTSSVMSPRALGSVNGIGQTGASLARGLGPVVATSLFAYTLENNWLGGLGVYLVLITISLCRMPLAYKLPEKEWEHK